jgi:hypothetical protein
MKLVDIASDDSPALVRECNPYARSSRSWRPWRLEFVGLSRKAVETELCDPQ